MNDLLDFVALSLLPPWSWLRVAERLRAGDSPDAVLRRLAAGRRRDERDSLSTFRADAEAAIRRAQDQAIVAIAWNDAAYPVALTTIADATTAIASVLRRRMRVARRSVQISRKSEGA